MNERRSLVDLVLNLTRLIITGVSTIRVLRKSQPVRQLVRGMVNINHGGQSAFPAELIDQGAVLVLSGLNNTLAMQTNQSWCWPYWFEAQTDPASLSFVPCGPNLLTTNITHRNWTAIGIDGSPDESLVDPVGMMTPEAFGWSVMPYLRSGKQVFLPTRQPGETSQRLFQDSFPGVETSYMSSGGLGWSSTAMAMKIDGYEVIRLQNRIVNHSQHMLTLSLGYGVRPYNPLMIGHIHDLKVGSDGLHVNHKRRIIFLEEPTETILSDRKGNDPLAHGKIRNRTRGLKSRSGVATACAEKVVEVPVGGEACWEVLVSMRRHLPGTMNKVTSTDLDSEAKRMRYRLDARHSQTMSIRVPDQWLQDAFTGIRNRLYVFDDQTHFSPGCFTYHAHWFRDSAFIGEAFLNLGLTDGFEQKMDAYLQGQKRNGYFCSQTGEWDSTGQAVYTLYHYALKTGHPGYLSKAWQGFDRAGRYIVRERQRHRNVAAPLQGLMPPGLSAEHFGGNDHYYWDNFWSLKALEIISTTAGLLGLPDKKAWYADQMQAYREDLLRSFELAARRTESAILPAAPYRWPDAAVIGNLVAANPLQIFPADEPWVVACREYLWKEHVRGGLFFQSIIHSGFNPYLTVQIGRCFLEAGDERAFEVLQSVYQCASPTYTWPEAIHPGSGGGCMGDGDHGWAAAEFCNLTRSLLIHEVGDRLLIGPGVPDHWYEPGESFGVRAAPTMFGKISYEARIGEDQVDLSWQLDSRDGVTPPKIYFCLPADLKTGPPAAESLGRMDLHPLGHVRGREVYEKYRNVPTEDPRAVYQLSE